MGRYSNEDPEATCTAILYRDHDPRKPYFCDKPAVVVDCFFPIEWMLNRCLEHRHEFEHKPEWCYEI